MQLTMSLDIFPVPQPKSILQNDLWIDVPEARLIGFTQKVEISQALSDALQPLQTEDEDVYNERLYDAVWLAHHYFCLDQRPSFSFAFNFLRDDLIAGKFEDVLLRLHLEICEGTARLGFLQDF